MQRMQSGGECWRRTAFPLETTRGAWAGHKAASSPRPPSLLEESALWGWTCQGWWSETQPHPVALGS